jgi:tyrosinase
MDLISPLTAYAQVKAILDAAAGDSPADYGGAGRFWAEGATTLTKAEVYGVRMVADAPAPP